MLGERRETLEYNFNYLKDILDAGLLLRRINIRQVLSLGSYPAAKTDYGSFLKYKEKINEEINRPLLKRVFPVGTVIRNVLLERERAS